MSAETQHTDPDNKKVAASWMESGKWLKEVIFKQQIKFWRAGGTELEFVFAYLVAELVFSQDDPSEWNIVHSSVDVREINRVLRREEETIQKLLKSKSFFWEKTGYFPSAKKCLKIQPEPYRYADLIILSFSAPHWVKFWCCSLFPIK